MNGTNGGEAVAGTYLELSRDLGWQNFDFAAFTHEVEKRVEEGMKAEIAGAAVFNELKRNNPDLAEKVEGHAGNGQPSAKSRDAAQPLAPMLSRPPT